MSLYQRQNLLPIPVLFRSCELQLSNNNICACSPLKKLVENCFSTSDVFMIVFLFLLSVYLVLVILLLILLVVFLVGVDFLLQTLAFLGHVVNGHSLL